MVKSKVDKALAKQLKLKADYETLRGFDLSYGFEANVLAGVDEAGRGPLAGPVVAAAVILPLEAALLGINDSKQVVEKNREALYDQILASCVGYGVGIVDADEIDAINILQATKKAMRLALDAISPQCALIDAVKLEGCPYPIHGIIKGDAQSYVIAAASIIAKVTRDRLMVAYDLEYPGYGFAKHKGYGTAEHYTALAKYGPSKIHRASFLKKWSVSLENQ